MATARGGYTRQLPNGSFRVSVYAGTDPLAQLMDRYTEVADWDLSTRKANEVCIRRVIKPALGQLQVRKIRGPLLDLLYAQLRRCSNPGCTGKRFIEYRNVPLLAIDPMIPWRQPLFTGGCIPGADGRRA